MARKLDDLAEQVCASRPDLKADDVINATKEMAGKWPLDIETLLAGAAANAKAGFRLPWEV